MFGCDVWYLCSECNLQCIWQHIVQLNHPASFCWRLVIQHLKLLNRNVSNLVKWQRLYGAFLIELLAKTITCHSKWSHSKWESHEGRVLGGKLGIRPTVLSVAPLDMLRTSEISRQTKAGSTNKRVVLIDWVTRHFSTGVQTHEVVFCSAFQCETSSVIPRKQANSLLCFKILKTRFVADCSVAKLVFEPVNTECTKSNWVTWLALQLSSRKKCVVYVKKRKQDVTPLCFGWRRSGEWTWLIYILKSLVDLLSYVCKISYWSCFMLIHDELDYWCAPILLEFVVVSGSGHRCY